VKPGFVSDHKLLAKPASRWLTIGGITAALTVSGIAFYTVYRFRRSPVTADSVPAQVERSTVSALGYLQPDGEVINLSAPIFPNGVGSRVSQILVQEGDWVEAGEAIAILDNFESLQAAVAQAERRVEVAQANLAQVQAGAKTGELEAQNATIARLKADLQGQLEVQDRMLTRLQAELEYGQAEFARYQSLFQEGAITASQLDSKRLAMITAQEQWDEAQKQRSRIEVTFHERINAARATLDQMAEVRPTDIRAAEAEVQRAIADVTKAKADLNLATIRAPLAGQILQIHARPGEVVGDRGIAALGQTRQMNVVAEVYELDVGRVRVGQTATIASDAFSETLQGEVLQVGFQVNSQNVLSTDPVTDVDQRVVEVKIRLNPADSQRVAALTNLQVTVVIDLHS